MNNPFPIKTDFGILKGRDILFLDDVKIEYSDAKLSLIGEINGEYASSFDEIKKSEWITELRGKTSVNHQHYRVVTYDHVFEVVAVGYEWQF